MIHPIISKDMVLQVLSLAPPDQHQRLSSLNRIAWLGQDLLNNSAGRSRLRPHCNLELHCFQDHDHLVFV
jgi:hypothetical protein